MIIRKVFKAEAAHRLMHSYTLRCQGLHGHSYVFEVFLKGETQDQAQMLMDFTLVAEKFHNFLDSFDHAILAWEKDQELVERLPVLNPRYIILPYNPTAEQMSRHIYLEGKRLGLPIHRVAVHETPTGCAIFEGDDNISFDLNQVIFSPAIQESWK